MLESGGLRRVTILAAMVLVALMAAAVVAAGVGYRSASAMAPCPAEFCTNGPLVWDVAPDGGTALATNGNVTATFDVTMNSNTINPTTFKLKKTGARKAVSAQVTSDVSEAIATLNPNNDLKPGATYKAIIVGGPNGVKDTEGRPLRGAGSPHDPSTTYKDGKLFWTLRTFSP